MGAARTVEDLAKALGLGTVTVHHHLRLLTKVGMVDEIAPRRSGKSGRPASVFRLSGQPGVLSYPPRDYKALAGMLVEIASKLAPPARFRAVAAATGKKVGKQVAAGLLERSGRRKWTLADVQRWFVEEHSREMGFAPEVVASTKGSLRFRLHNCIFLEIAREKPDLVCAMDVPMMRAMLDETLGARRADVTLVGCMGHGHPHCEYLIELSSLVRSPRRPARR